MILASPGSEPGEARARAAALVAVADAHAVAAAARASAEPFCLLLAPGARPLAGAFGGLAGALTERAGVVGGAAHCGGVRRFGWMLAPAPASPLPFALAEVTAAAGEPGADARARGPIDVVAPGMVLAARELLLEPLPDDPVAALVELCARARAAGRDVVCRPSFACEIPAPDADDRGRFAALRAVAERRPELRGTFWLPPGSRRGAVDRQVRLPGGRRTRARTAAPPLTVLVHGEGAELAARRARDLAPGAVAARAVDDPATALRAEMRVRGDRYVLVVAAHRLPGAAVFDALVAALESASYVAVAAPDAAALDGSCVLLALARFPQHVEAAGTTLAEAVASLTAAARALRRGLRAPGHAVPAVPAAAAAARSATIVFAAGSTPEVLRLTVGAAVEASRPGDELVAACAAGAATTRRIVASYPQLRIEEDAVDPLLAGAVNRALGAANGDLVALVADDVLLPAGALDRLRAAFARIPALGAAFPAVPGAPGGEGVDDVRYADIAALRALAEQRAAERAREAEPVDVAVSSVIVVAREALAAVGGIDPAHGPTRRGIADLVLRLRAAGYAVVRCDDALVHRFDPALSHNPAAAADHGQAAPVADPAAVARGFDPAQRVPFVPAATARAPVVPAAAGTPALPSHAIAVPVGAAAELERAAVFLASAARAFDASSPVRVHLLLDGALAPADAVARVRPVLAASGKPMDDTLAVRIERAADLAGWRAGIEPGVRVVVAAGHERDALAGLTTVSPHALAELLEPVAR